MIELVNEKLTGTDTGLAPGFTSSGVFSPLFGLLADTTESYQKSLLAATLVVFLFVLMFILFLSGSYMKEEI